MPGCSTIAAPVSPNAREHVQDAGREARLLGQLPESQRGERRLLGRLQDHRAARRQRRRDLPRRHQQREVPRDDLAADPDRLLERVDERVRPRDRDGLALDLRWPAGVVAQVRPPWRRRRPLRANVTGLPLSSASSSASSSAFSSTRSASLCISCSRPEAGSSLHGPSSAACAGLDGAVDVLAAGLRHLADHVARGGVDRLEGLAGRGLDPLVADQELVRASSTKARADSDSWAAVAVVIGASIRLA